MSKRWYYHLLWSYLPVFFLITLSLMFMSFYTIGKFTENAAVKANGLFTQYAIQVIDHSLKSIEQTMYQELTRNEKINYFFYNFNNNTYYTVYEPSRLMNDMVTSSNLLDSIYLVRMADHTVLSANATMDLDQHGDREFIYKNLIPTQFTESLPWSAKRMYKEFPNGTSKEVVSLVLRTPLASGSMGLVVLNVKTETLGKLISGLSGSGISYMELLDKEGNTIQGAIPANVRSHSNINKVVSPYSGWVMESSLKNDLFFSFVNSTSHVSLAIGIFAILLGMVWIVYVSRRNTQPIESITKQIQTVLHNKGKTVFHKQAKNEFQFIASAVEAMIEQSNQFLKKDEENLAYKRQLFLREVLDWKQIITNSEWDSRMNELELPNSFHQLTAGVIEIDKYPGFIKEFSTKDQNLLRFSLYSVLKEMSDKHQFKIWAEWSSDSNISIIHFEEEEVDSRSVLKEFYEELIDWVKNHLRMSISVGLGQPVSELIMLRESYENALLALDHKLALGEGLVIDWKSLRERPQGEAYGHLQLISQLTQQFRLGQDDWKLLLSELYSLFRQECISDSDFHRLMDYLMYQLDKELRRLPPGQVAKWAEVHYQKLHKIIDQTESLEEVYQQCESYLTAVFEELQVSRTMRNSYQQMEAVKDYIDRNYSDFDLSLDHLSEKFGIAPKYLSQLFKEELGEKFIDYLARVRVEKAKVLLVQGNGTIQEIAEKMGYHHSFSFIRVFKKLTGRTPGDYRAEYPVE